MSFTNDPGVTGTPAGNQQNLAPRLKLDLARAKEEIANLDQDNKVLRQRIIELERVDQLTGLLNRKSFLEKLGEEFLRAGRYHHPLGLAIVDPDHLKHINDEYGQQKGDEVLKIIADTTRDVARDGDSFGRISGQVIAVILPYATMQNSHAFAERLRKRVIALINHPSVSSQIPCRITTSIGAASTEAGIGTQEILLQQAENMSLLAKASGGNTANIYQYKPETQS